MLEERGQIVALDGNRAWVQTIRQSACNSCQAKSGCGQSVMSKLSDGKASQVLVNNSFNLQIGDEVLLGIEESAMVRASFAVYMLPLIIMLVFASLTSALFPSNEPAITSFGLLGLGVGFLLVRLYSLQHQGDKSFEPEMLKKIHISCLDEVDSNLDTQAIKLL